MIFEGTLIFSFYTVYPIFYLLKDGGIPYSLGPGRRARAPLARARGRSCGRIQGGRRGASRGASAGGSNGARGAALVYNGMRRCVCVYIYICL